MYWTRSENWLFYVRYRVAFSIPAGWWSDPGREYGPRDARIVYKTRAFEPSNPIFPLVRILPLACLFRSRAHPHSVRIPHRRISPDRRGLQATRISRLTPLINSTSSRIDPRHRPSDYISPPSRPFSHFFLPQGFRCQNLSRIARDYWRTIGLQGKRMG